MENSNFKEYKFENYDVRGLKLEINFSKSDSIKIKAHEEINIPIENDTLFPPKSTWITPRL